IVRRSLRSCFFHSSFTEARRSSCSAFPPRCLLHPFSGQRRVTKGIKKKQRNLGARRKFSNLLTSLTRLEVPRVRALRPLSMWAFEHYSRAGMFTERHFMARLPREKALRN